MNQSIYFIFLACLVISTTNLPLKVTESVPTSEENIGKVNDTIKVENPDVFAKILEVNKGQNSTILIVQGDILKQKGRSALSCEKCLWPKSTDGTVQVPYTLASSYSGHINVTRLCINLLTNKKYKMESAVNHQKLFMSAMQEYDSLTCVRFIPRTTENNYLNILSDGGCLSNVGRIGGAQTVRLAAPGCMNKGVIQHELNHVLGFYHENTRTDRDKYIIIYYENIASGSESDFAIVNGNNLSLPYDYNSVMHFDKYAYSIDNSKPTIEPTPDPNVPIGQRYGISVLDVAKINKLYDCKVCSTLLNTPKGNVLFANYSSDNPVNCVWLIRTPSGQVSLTFNDFNIQDSNGCTSEYMQIYDGPSRSSPILLNKICGTIQIPTIIGSNNQMLIEFVSANVTKSTRFSASYDTVSCGGTFFTERNEFTSPGYASGSYFSNMNCDFMIYAPTGYRILLNGIFNIDTTPLCSRDKLTVYGSGVVGQPRYMYCGTGTFSIKSVSNKLLLNFQTDMYIQKKGFSVTYSIEP